MSKMGRKITALMLALLMATSTCSVGLAAQEQVGSIGTAVSASAGDTVTVTFDSQGGAELPQSRPPQEAPCSCRRIRLSLAMRLRAGIRSRMERAACSTSIPR